MTSPAEPSPPRAPAAMRWAPPLLGFLAVAAVFRDVLAGETLFFADFTYIHHPLERFGAARLSEGSLPVWNPDLALGLPQLANPIAASLYPPNLLLAVLPFTWAVNAMQAAHVALALWVMARLVGALTGEGDAGRWAGLAAGSAFALSGAMLSSTAYGYPVLAWPWVGLAALGATRLAQGGVPGRAVATVAAGTGLCLLAGDPAAAGTAVLLGAALLAALAPGGARIRASVRLALGVALGVGLAGAQVLPTLAFLPESVRASGAAPGALGTWSFAPERLLGFVEPAFWGRFAPEMSYWGQHLAGALNDGSFFYASHYLGTAPLVLAPLAVADRRLRRPAMALLLVALVALLLSFGRWLPGYATLVHEVPGLGLLRYPERWVMATSAALAAAGGLGLVALHRGELGRAGRAASLLVAGAVVVTSAAVILLDETLRGVIRAHAVVPLEDAARAAQIGGALLSGLSAAIVGAAVALRERPIFPLKSMSWATTTVAVVATIAVMDAAVGNGGLVWTAPADLFDTPAATVGLIAKDVPEAPKLRVGRDEGLNRVRMHRDLDGLVARYRAQLATLRANAVIEAGAARAGAETPARLDHPVQPDAWLLGDPARVAPLLGVHALLVAAQRPPAGVKGAPEGSLRLAGGVPALGMAIVTPTEPPLPGAFCVASVAPVPRSQVASALSALDPRVTAVVEPETALGPREGLADQLQGLAAVSNTRAWPCATVQREATRIVAHARLDRPALLVVQSAFAGGWSARVDGRPWPLVRAYGSLAALPLDPGEHEVVLSYEAPGLAEGLWTTAVSAVGLLLLWLVPLWRGRKDGRNEEE